MSSPSLSVSARLALLALFSASTFYCLYKSRRLSKLLSLTLNPSSKPPSPPSRKAKLFFISQTGTSKALAGRLFDLLDSKDLAFDLVDPCNYEPEDLPKETLVLIVASTWEDGKAPANAKFFTNWLAESADDFRVGSLLLSHCKFAVFGVGSRAYGATFNAVARDISRHMKALGAAEILPVWEGDVDEGDIDEVFDAWSGKVIGFLKGGVVENGGLVGNVVDAENDAYSGDETDEENSMEAEIVDLEDIAGKGPSRRSATTVAKTNGTLNGKKDMVTPVIRASLEKQVILEDIFLAVFMILMEIFELYMLLSDVVISSGFTKSLKDF